MTRHMTITEKIMAASANLEEVSPGQLINARVDLAYTMDFMGKVVFDKLHQLGATAVFDKEKVVVIFDHAVPAPDVKWAELHNAVRKEIREFGVRSYDVGNHGIMHHVVAEEGHLVPGIVALGTDSHAPTGGALGALAIGVGATDVAVAMATGAIWLRVPEAVRVTVSGELAKGVMARDISTFLMGQKGWDGTQAEWTYRSVEFTGPTVGNMEMDDRFSLCNLVSDMGAKNAIVAADEKTLAYVRNRAKCDPRIYESDPDAVYAEEFAVDVTDLEPLVSCPHSPDNVHKIADVSGTAINVAFIGTCANGRLSDLRAAADLLKGRKVSPSVRLYVSPVSQKVYRQALDDGLLATLSDAGAVILPASCSPCIGINLVILGAKDVALSSGPRNMKGRMGSYDAQVYTANPLVVAASAIAGEITDPRAFIKSA